MSSSILDAIQGLATPALMQTATAALGLPDKAVNAGLGAAATSLLGGLIKKSGDASVMSSVAGLIGSVPTDASLLSNVSGLLTGGMPVSPANVLGNKFLGQIAGSNAASMISGIATASGVSAKAASGLTTLAAPLVLTALRSKLGATPTAAGLASMLMSERSLIAAAMPSSLQSLYGLAGAATAAAAAPVVAAVAAPVATAPAARIVAPAPVVQAAAPVAQTPAPVVQAAAAGVQSPVVVKTAAGPVPVAAAAPVVQTSSGHASAPAVVQAAAPAKTTIAAATPAVARPAASMQQAVAHEATSTSWAALLGLFIPLALLTGLVWYFAYGTSGALSIASATKVVTAPAIEAAQKKVADVVQQAAPKPAAPAPAPVAAPAAAPAPAPVAAPAAPGPLVAMPGANGMVVYELPGGGKIEVAKDGLESKLLAFVGSKDAAVDKKLWFDFDRLSFVTASSDLTPESASQVASAVSILKAYPNLQVKIGGYTDNQGDPAANLKLSDTRAKRVMDQMVKDGIAAPRLEAEGYGEQFPIGDNATPEGRAKNRRTALSVRQK